MDVSRTLAATFRTCVKGAAAARVWLLFAIERRRRSARIGDGSPRSRACVLAVCCGAAVTWSGCQSLRSLASQQKSPDDVRQTLAAALEQDRPLPAATGLNSAMPVSAPATGPTGVATLLQRGDQALSEHSQNPARLSDARNQFEEVLRTDPANATAHHRLGVIADLSRNFPEAERHYAQALQRTPNDPQLLHDIGYSYLLQDQPQQAIPYLERSVELAPGFEMASRKLADAYVRTRQTDLAQRTLARLVPAAQVQDELNRLQAAHDPASRPSLLGRVRDNMRDLRPEESPASDPNQQLLAELQQARQAGDQARLQRAQQSVAAAGTSGPAAPNAWSQSAPTVHDSQLSTAIAGIEAAARPYAGRPMYIDPRAGGSPVYGHPQAVASAAGAWGQPGGVPGPMSGGQVPAYGGPGADPASIPIGSYPGSPNGGAPSTATGEFHYAEVIRGTQRGTASPAEAVYAQSRPTLPAGNGSPPAVEANPSAISMAGGQLTPGSLRDGVGGQSAGVQNADYAAAPIGYNEFGSPALQPSLMSPALAGNGATAHSYEMQASGARTANEVPGATSAADDYRAAAALGMGAGPGQMFPVIRQADVSSAGSGSRWNGAQYPQPGRFLPSEQPIPDLTQAFQQPSAANAQGAAVAPPPNSMGQQMPASSQYWSSPQQFSGATQAAGAPTPNADTAQWTRSMFQAPPVTPGYDPGLQAYDQIRGVHDAQLNASIQQVQGQYPSGQMLTPSYGLPIDRPAPGAAMMNSYYAQDAAGSPTASDQRVVTPAPYYPGIQAGVQPVGGQSAPQIAPLPNVHAVASQLPPAEYGSKVVVPPSYPGARGGWGSPAAASYGSGVGGYQGPMIVPGQ